MASVVELNILLKVGGSVAEAVMFSDLGVVATVYIVATVVCRTGGRAVAVPVIVKCRNYVIKMLKRRSSKISIHHTVLPMDLYGVVE
jgi:hypothetical protein